MHAKLRSQPGFAGFGSRDKHITGERAEALASRFATAIRNARALVDACSADCSARRGHAKSCNPLGRDPSTDVYLLIESLGIVGQL